MTCFEVVEHLDTFVPLVEWSNELAREGTATFVISVPNDAFWSIKNPHHRTSWGDGAFEELQRLLPAERTLLRQVSLAGSAALGWDAAAADYELAVSVGGEGMVPTHFIAAYGPRHEQLWRGALATETDMLEQRRWERQRENDLALMQKVAAAHDEQVNALDEKIVEQREELQERTVWFEEWRTYIHELEGELGRPLSGVSPEELPDAQVGLAGDGVKVAFLVNDLQLSGGVGVVIQHARRLSLREGWDVTLVLARSPEGPSWHGYEHLPHLHVRAREDAVREHYDVAIATWWETTFTLFELHAERHAYFVQSLEDRFYRPDQAERLGAALTLDLPVAFITEARWIAKTLAGLRPDAPCYLVRNGIDKEVFGPLERLPEREPGPLRILIEGSPSSWFKGVHEAIITAAAMREPRHVTVVTGEREALGDIPADEVIGPLSHREMAARYGESDVVLKLSRVEGMFGPPLEGFHRGATCVVTPVTGHDEYVEHGWNGLLTDLGRPARERAAARPPRTRPRASLLPAPQRARDSARVAIVGAGERVHGRRADGDPPRAPAHKRRRGRAVARRRAGRSRGVHRSPQRARRLRAAGAALRAPNRAHSGVAARARAHAAQALPPCARAHASAAAPHATDPAAALVRAGGMRRSRIRRAAGRLRRGASAIGATGGAPTFAGGTFEAQLELARNGPAPLRGEPPHAHGALRIATVIPSFRRGSGGHATIARLLEGLGGRGHDVSVWLEDGEGRHAREADSVTARSFGEFFGAESLELKPSFDEWRGADVVLATGWQTVARALLLEGVAGRAYLVQDHEPDFYPTSAESLWAQESYRQGLHCIAASEWLAAMLRARYGASATHFELAVDRAVYRPEEDGEAQAAGGRRDDLVAFYARALTPRRAVPLGLLALTELRRRRPDVEIVLFGEDRPLEVPFAHRNVGVLDGGGLAALYREAAVGMVLSLTNPSLVALEMMACGLPCVELASESILATFGRESPLALAEAEPVALCEAIERLLDEPARRASATEAGVRLMAARSWERAAEELEQGLQLALATRGRHGR